MSLFFRRLLAKTRLLLFLCSVHCILKSTGFNLLYMKAFYHPPPAPYSEPVILAGIASRL